MLVRAAAATLAVGGALVVAACGTVGRSAEGNLSRGKQLFTERCGSCHTLADAGSQGQTGPNLDKAFATVGSNRPGQGFEASTIRDVIKVQIAYPVEDPPTGAPGMPANLVTGADADAVAAYVASVAGLPRRSGAQGGAAGGGTGGAAGGGETSGRAIFTSAGCGGCHVLSAAGSKGTVGPNLDETKPTLERAIEQTRKGGGGMPAFEGRLSDEQIRAVAEYVSENAGK